MITKHPKASDMKTRLDELGLRPFTDAELRDLSQRLRTTIDIGLNRQGEPVITDGGVLAAATGVQAITPTQVRSIPDGQRGITAACGGTNWIFAETRKQPDGQVVIGRSFVRTIPEQKRQHTFDSFAEIIADGMARVAEQYDLMNEDVLPLSLSLGFPQINSQTPQGDIDAKIPRRHLPKFWEITDYDESIPPNEQPSLGERIKEKLRARGVHGVHSIAIVNDTVAVGLDVQHDKDAPVGFVFGTGTNGAMYAGTEKGMVNLEIGHAEIMDKDAMLTIMQTRGWAPDTRRIMEYIMGGAFIPARVMAGIELLKDFVSSPDAINQQISESSNPALMSDMAKGRQSPLVGLSLAADDYFAAHLCARRAIHQAGQLIGIHIGTVCEAVGYTNGKVYVPYEGSVLGKGYLVKQRALQTVKTLLPNVELIPYEASGMVGVAKLAMVRLFEQPTKVPAAAATQTN